MDPDFTLQFAVRIILRTSRLNLYFTQLQVGTYSNGKPYSDVYAKHSTGTRVHSSFPRNDESNLFIGALLS